MLSADKDNWDPLQTCEIRAERLRGIALESGEFPHYLLGDQIGVASPHCSLTNPSSSVLARPSAIMGTMVQN